MVRIYHCQKSYNMSTSRITRLSEAQVRDGVIVAPETAYTEISLSKLRSKLRDTLNRVQYGRRPILVTNYGKRVAQIFPVLDE